MNCYFASENIYFSLEVRKLFSSPRNFMHQILKSMRSQWQRVTVNSTPYRQIQRLKSNYIVCFICEDIVGLYIEMIHRLRKKQLKYYWFFLFANLRNYYLKEIYENLDYISRDK